MSEQNLGHEQDPQFTQRFIDATESVNEYNRRHTGLGGAMTSIFHMIVDQVKDESDEPRVSHAEEAQMERELIQLLQTDDLENMGITLFDTNSAGVKKFEIDEEAERPQLPSSLFMLITDGDKFKDTLYHLNPTEEQREQTENGVATLLNSTANLIEAAYPYKAPEDGEEKASPDVMQAVLHQQLDQFIDLSPALVQQGFDNSDAFATLTEYAARYASGVLSEYRVAEQQNLLSGPDRFGPSVWPCDMSADTFTKRWSEALNLLDRLRNREEPTDFFTELFNKLRADFDASRTWLDEQPMYDDTPYQQAYEEYRRLHDEHRAKLEASGKEPSYDDLYGENAPQAPEHPEGQQGLPKSYVAPLQAAMDQLQERWANDFSLENSFYLSEKQENDGQNDTTA